MIGFESELYLVGTDWQITCPAEGYAAVGSGAPVALGALAATGDLKGKARTKAVLSAAQAHNAGVREPFHYVAGDGKLKRPQLHVKLGKDYLQP